MHKEARTGVWTCTDILPSPKGGSIYKKKDKFTLQSFDINICSEDDATTVLGKEF